MAEIAGRFRITVAALIAQNPHIPNPDVLYPGDILCVPGAITRPCCTVLNIAPTAPPVPLNIRGVVLIDQTATGNETVAIMAIYLPPPGQFGQFNGYQAVIEVAAGVGPYSVPLLQPGQFPGPDSVFLPPIWSGMATIPPVLTPATTVLVVPVGRFTGERGPAILRASLESCLAARGRRPGE